MQVQPGDSSNYKKKYKTLKRKLRMLIYEQECFAEELRRAQRKLLRISRDKSFLLDRLLQYEEVDASATDTDVTASSGSDDDQPPPPKRKKAQPGLAASAGVMTLPHGSAKQVTASAMFVQATSNMTSSEDTQPKKKVKLTKKASKLAVTSSPSAHVMRPPAQPVKSSKSPQMSRTNITHTNVHHALSRQEYERLNRLGMAGSDMKSSPVGPDVKHSIIGHGLHDVKHGPGGHDVKRGPAGHAMTREELEQHLEMKSSAKLPFMRLEQTPHILPENIFNDNSNSCDFPDNKTTDDEDLVIDVP